MPESAEAEADEGPRRYQRATGSSTGATGRWKASASRSSRTRDGDGKADTVERLRRAASTRSRPASARAWSRCGRRRWFTPARRTSGASRADGTTDEKLLSGFGVHIAYGGHDMHGVKIRAGRAALLDDRRLRRARDDEGRQGDRHSRQRRGLPLRARRHAAPNSSPSGLRNPQSLAFNDVGDLFTGDNNADGGDKARWTHVVEGADYGWRIGWQFLPKLGAWNSEGMWHLDAAETNLAHAPAGRRTSATAPRASRTIPAPACPTSIADHFFYADFPGGVRAFALKPKGASYTVENPGDDPAGQLAERDDAASCCGACIRATCSFGAGGGAYVLDWV